MNAPLPTNEAERLAALKEYHVLDSETEQSYDDITALAAHICEAPIAMVSLVDETRQWFKSRVGLEQQQTPREVAFCAHAILQSKPFIVRDATKDRRFADSALVTGEPHIRFYAGIPLTNPEGLALGTLCVIDQQPAPAFGRTAEGATSLVAAGHGAAGVKTGFGAPGEGARTSQNVAGVAAHLRLVQTHPR